MTSVDTPAAAPARTEPRTLFRGKGWFWVPIVPLVALDLWSKVASFGFLAERYPGYAETARSHEVFAWDGIVSLSWVSWRNTGTIWGLGRDFHSPLVVLRCFALALVVYFAWRSPTKARLQQLVLGLIMAGAIGNLYDNLTQKAGGVRDFIHFYGFFGTEYSFPAFNVADSCICVGAITLAALLWRKDGAQST